MSDTQWPRFEVFQQEEAGQPHLNTHAVHAPDPEMALLMARDVFVRRPDCFSLWVTPASKIHSKTAQELAAPAWPVEVETDAAKIEETQPPAEPYYVFQKLRQQGRHTYAGQVEARTPVEALRRALTTFKKQKALAWWVLPARWVTHSTPDDVDSMFAPARAKTFRDQSEYHTVSMMHKVKRASRPAKERA
ncbi:MAG: phenylacetic acid degradation protein [Chloroflexota bacterium]